jgi:hypothetical protein
MKIIGHGTLIKSEKAGKNGFSTDRELYPLLFVKSVYSAFHCL